ncbi:MAG: hemerythrin domain-containing protein [Cryobacterium sp.]|nr:hemerythrin domain-containing protein [Cryobacterium sp.]
MPATALPSSGDQPPSGVVKTCDASGMAEIHRMYRAGFAEGPALVRGVKAGDVAHARVVAENLGLLSVSLHAHHEGEDLRLWSTLAERAPSCSVHVERMKEQHAQMLTHLNELDPAVAHWRSTAAISDAAPVLAALDGVNAALAVHLGDEETNIVPVMETTLTEPEVEWFAAHGRAATPKGQTWNSLGAIIAAQPDGGTEWLHKNLPAPVRLLWRFIGKRKYEAHRAALVGN